MSPTTMRRLARSKIQPTNSTPTSRYKSLKRRCHPALATVARDPPEHQELLTENETGLIPLPVYASPFMIHLACRVDRVARVHSAASAGQWYIVYLESSAYSRAERLDYPPSSPQSVGRSVIHVSSGVHAVYTRLAVSDATTLIHHSFPQPPPHPP